MPTRRRFKAIEVYGNQIRIGIREAGSTRKGRPLTCSGCTLFMFIGDAPPTPAQTWQTLGNVTKNEIIVTLPNDIMPNTRVWFCGYWYTQRGLSSPTCEPISTYTTHGGATPLKA